MPVADLLRRRLEAQIDDGYYPYRLGTTDTELMFYMMFTDGLERDPVAAFQRTVARINAERAALGIEIPFRLTAALSDGTNVYAIRYSTDDAPPSLFWSREDDHLLVVSEPLDETDGRTRQEVPGNQILVARQNCAVDIAPFIPG